MNLHEWITVKVDEVEAERRSVVLVPNDGSRPIVGTVTATESTADGLELTVAQHGPEVDQAAIVLRRCEADRRILARHKLPEPGHWTYPACEGCGWYGDMGDPATDNLNDCPELLDLAHAHGITAEELAGLDRLERVGVAPVVPFAHMAVTPVITTDQVPAALRGGAWRRRHH